MTAAMREPRTAFGFMAGKPKTSRPSVNRWALRFTVRLETSSAFATDSFDLRGAGNRDRRRSQSRGDTGSPTGGQGILPMTPSSAPAIRRTRSTHLLAKA